MLRPSVLSLLNRTVLIIPLLTSAGHAAEQEAGTRSTSLPTRGDASTVPSDPRTAQIRALMAGTLDVSVSPQTLFDVALDDEVALKIESARVRALLRAADEASQPPRSTSPSRTRNTSSEAPEVKALRAEITGLDPALWRQRVELDRTRLEFYDLGAARRAELLSAHRSRQEAARPKETEEQRRAREADAERARALEAAKAARSEAERIVSEELARLISLETRIRQLGDEFKRARDDLVVRRDTVLGWQRRVREAKVSGALEADSTYDALRRTLRASRDDLSAALDALTENRSEVPALGSDPLGDIPPDVPTEAVHGRRHVVEQEIAEARGEERALQAAKASALLDEIDTLNRERLGLLPSLSPDKRDAITGFTAASWDQARSEARHLSLILRYHQHVVSAWISAVRSGRSEGVPVWRTTRVLLPLLVVVVAFIWGRRKARVLIRWAEVRLAAEHRAERRVTPSVTLRATRILLKTHQSLEWMLFLVAVAWLLPSGASGLLEVQIVSSVVVWILAGSLIVNVVNALAAGDASTVLPLRSGESGRVRLRSLRLVGGTVIMFALILVLTARLVGEGTIYRWVWSTCWFAAVPVFLLLVMWWRGTVFDRLDRLRKKTPLQAWILANRSGWKSFASAMTGAVQLFTMGVLKHARSWISGFDLARRVHAYLFKREIERIGEGSAHAELEPLPGEVFEKLRPDMPFLRWLSCPADELREELTRRAVARRGALIAVIAPRGMGKSSLLRAVNQQVRDSAVLECSRESTTSDLHAALDDDPAIVLVDDTHTLVEPRIGGLAQLDEWLAFGRAHSAATTWVFAIDASVWPLLRRARDARPMFDETHVLARWTEDEIGALIADRCGGAGITPLFDALLDRLPPGADEIDRQDALRAKRAGYERMLWDYVGGNPGLALEAWRASLGQGQAGIIHVRPLQVPDMTKLELLPDSSLFVLRAVLQMAPATVETVAQATRLRPDEVLQDLRFGKAQGFYDDQAGRVRIAWPWLRAVSRLLERRQLLGRT